MAEYQLRCVHPSCGKLYPEDPEFRLFCDQELAGAHEPSFLEAVYDKKQIDLHEDAPGIFAFADWLPVGKRYLKVENELGRPHAYPSHGLAKRLGLRRLHIAFSGFWPERGANLLTRSFKEFEAQATMARYLSRRGDQKLPAFIISSAGNTANGFNLVSHEAGVPVYLVVPESGLDRLLLPFPTRPFTVVVRGDYTDAIAVADAVAKASGLAREGGARNVARRAGLGTVMLNAVAHPRQGTGKLFDHYFQAVGSGTGAIGVFEAVELLKRDGRFGATTTRIHVAQNAPFAPIVDAWKAGQRALLPFDDKQALWQIDAVTASVLTNRRPPYGIHGGVFDVLKASRGAAWRVENSRIFEAARLFREAEGVDIGAAAAVAVDALCQAVGAGAVKADEPVLLHVTGGGREMQHSAGAIHPVTPNLVVGPSEIDKVLAAIGEPRAIIDPAAHLAAVV
ncbi:MAG TPA: cysteate synthase [Minicystis sp.]|nr:cysteate synthase [Minicystis sp.]